MKMMTVLRIFITFLMIKASTQLSMNPRIVNGLDASINQFPFLVSIEMGYPPLKPFSHECSGVPYDEYHILTTASCAKKLTKWTRARAKIGVHFTNEEHVNIDIYEIVDKIVHEDYISSTEPRTNNIALFVVRPEIPHALFVKISQQQYPVGEVWIAGWGKTSTKPIGATPKVLQYASLVIIDNQYCQKKVSSLQKHPVILNTHICAHSPTKKTTAYIGDGGGPVLKYVNEKPEVIGLVTWTAYPEMKVGAPTVSTRIFDFIPWIHRKIQENPKDQSDSSMDTPLLVS